MMSPAVLTRVALAGCALLAITACSKKAEPAKAPEAPVVVAPPPPPEPTATIELGRALGADTRVLAALDTFKLRDTIYASVTTANAAPGAQLIATWTHESGATVKVDTGAVAAINAFHISKKTAWPPGTYTVALTSDGKSLGSRSFTVKGK
jgi:hypothetical protein